MSCEEGSIAFKLRVERRKFDALTRDLIARARTVVENALTSAHITAHDIDEVSHSMYSDIDTAVRT